MARCRGYRPAARALCADTADTVDTADAAPQAAGLGGSQMRWMKWVLAAGVTVGVVLALQSKDDFQRYRKMRDM